MLPVTLTGIPIRLISCGISFVLYLSRNSRPLSLMPSMSKARTSAELGFGFVVVVFALPAGFFFSSAEELAMIVFAAFDCVAPDRRRIVIAVVVVVCWAALPAALPAALLDDFFGAEDWARRVFGASFASFAAFDFVVDRRLRLLEDMVIGCVVPLDNGGCRRCNGKSYCSVVVDLVVEGNGTAVAVV